jgi:hypothetical protein
MINTKKPSPIKNLKSPLLRVKIVNPAITRGMDGVSRRRFVVVKKVKKIRQKQKQKPVFVVPFKPTIRSQRKFVFSQKLYPATLFRKFGEYKSNSNYSNAQLVSSKQASEKWWRAGTARQVSVAAALVALFLAFGGGIWATLATSKSAAYNSQSQVLADTTTVPGGSVVMPGAELPPANPPEVSNDVLFNTPIQELQNYLANVSQPDIIANRTTQLTKFLTDMHSPFASAASTIANQSHWDLILAISFAESTLGKNCKDNNCSNIGVGPNSPYWRTYGSYDGWVVDFNRLLDKKYNDWTLEQMCGVYVKPCNPNWLAATQQILGELKDRGIE